MNRKIPLFVFALAVIGLFLVPSASKEKLAAFHIGELLEPQEGDPSGTPHLMQLLLEAPTTSWDAEHKVADVLIGGVRMKTPKSEKIDLLVHAEARRSLIRSLRVYASDKQFALSERDLRNPDPSGPIFLAAYTDGQLSLEMTIPKGAAHRIERKWEEPTQLTLLPALIAIFFSILLRKPILSLLAGVLLGAVLVPWIAGKSLGQALSIGVQAVPGKYLAGELEDSERTYIVLFVIFMLAMVGVITRAGGIRGLMDQIARLAKGVRGTQIATWFMGLAIFFDDYANTILVGSTMRPLADKARVSREKLAYIVDSTAAPVAGISIFSTWIAFEVSTFSASLPDAGIASSQGYSIFLQTLPYRFYCLLTLLFVGLITFLGRDFGPMLNAERRARRGQLLRPGARPMVSSAATELEPAAGVTSSASSALIPLGVFLGTTLFWILWSGGAFASGVSLASAEAWTQILYQGSGSKPLMVGSFAGFAVAALMAVLRGLNPGTIAGAAWSALRSMGVAIAILYLAWMIGAVCKDLGTAGYLAVVLGDAIPDIILPIILFLLSAMVAFSTGSSWSTMTILLPLVIGLAFRLGENGSIGGELLVVMSIGAVLEGAIFGDHCSPISDTTVMSSIASASDHIDHVRTQAPYALVTMLAALLLGYFPAAFFAADVGSVLPFACLGLGGLTLIALLFWKGEKLSLIHISEPTRPY